MGGGNRGRGGCFFLPLGLIVATMALAGSPFPAAPIILMVVLGLVLWSISQGKERVEHQERYDPSVYEPVYVPPRVTTPPPVEEYERRLRSIRKLHEGILGSLDQNKGQSVIEVTGAEIRQQADELTDEAERICASRKRLSLHLSESSITQQELRSLTQEAETESNPRVKAAMMATLESKRAEMENVQKLGENVRYLDALLEQAEATLSELKTRISLTLAETEDYTNPRSRLALTEASDQLKSVSDAMRETLTELQ